MGKKNNREPYNLLGEKIVETNEAKDLGMFSLKILNQLQIAIRRLILQVG